MAIWALVVLVYLNGNFVDVDMLHAPAGDVTNNTKAVCEKQAAAILESASKQVEGDMQLVAKCVDLATLPLTISQFGTKPKSTKL